ncbi:UBE3A [Scenedesmus sp. PABB004]|nr:UBE3A [Scenedesmus sp. PABB004]
MAAAPRRLLVCLALLAWCATAATSRDVAVAVDGGTHRRPTRTLRQGRPAAPRQAVPDICGATGQDAGSDTTTRCAQRCQVCVNDRTIATRNRTCLCCKAGFVPNREEPGRCRPCAPSTFSPTPGRARCMLCRGAFTTLRNGATSCDGGGGGSLVQACGAFNCTSGVPRSSDTVGSSEAACCVFSVAVATCNSTGAGAPSYDCANSTLPLPNALYAPASISGLTPAAAEAVCCTAHPAGATCIDIDGAGAGQVALNCTGAGWVNGGASTSIAGQTPSQARATCCTVYAAGATCGGTTGSSPALPFNCSGSSQPFPNALYAPANITGLTLAAAEAVCCKAYPAGATCGDNDGSLTAATQSLSCGNLVAAANATNTTIAGLSATEAAAACCTTAPAVALPVPAVAAGTGYTCALLNDTSVRCFGSNEYGQLGDGTNTTRPAPVRVTWPGGTPLTGVVSIVAGPSHACATLANGTAACWGRNFIGQLGGNSASFSQPNPVAVLLGGAPMTGVASIAAGAYHTCARLVNGTALCWGTNGNGQLGDNTTASRFSPAAVTLGGVPLTGVAEIVAGFQHTCVRLDNGTAVCWGFNGSGQLGEGTNTTSRPSPVAVTWPGGAPLTGVAQIAAGQYHTCATLANGTAVCWGDNASGALGDGTSGALGVNNNRLNPVAVSNLTGVALVAAGLRSTCAIAGGEVACFGSNYYSQLGTTVNAGTGNNLTPLKVLGQDPTSYPAVGVAVGDAHACIWLGGNLVVCFGQNNYGQLGRTYTDTSTSLYAGVLIESEAGFGERVAVDLAPGGAALAVGRGNVADYVAAYTQHLLVGSVARQFDAFQRGFLRLCSGAALQFFRPAELEQLVCGGRVVDLAALEAATHYDDGYDASSAPVRWFWEEVHALDGAARKRLLFFITGSDRVPIKGLGHLSPPFVISRNGADGARLPTAHTCFNHLLLPAYADRDTLRSRLLTALDNAEGFGLL